MMPEIPLEIIGGFIHSDQEEIYYESAGQGETVVFCHGLGGNHASWFQQVPFFARFYRCITWDQRGFGRSTINGKQTSPALAAIDLKRLIDQFGLAPVHLVGQSMGGWAAVGFALAYPHLVRSMVLADTLGGIYTAQIRQGFDTFLKQAAALPPSRPLLGYHPAVGIAFSRQSPVQAYLYQQLGSFGNPPSTLEMFQALRDTEYPTDALKNLTFPILCIVGSEDRLILPAWVRQVAAALPDAQVIEIASTGHSPYFEDAATWNQAVLTFLHQETNHSTG